MAGLYIHIPFCGRRCAYCDFYSTTSPDLTVSFLEALKREMTARRNFLPNERLDTIYIGGGTPSLLLPEQLQGLLNHAAGLWDCSEVREATVEANPEDLTDEYLTRLSETGFNRLSIGVQSFDDELLRFMNRRHDARRAKTALSAAQNAGFDNISIDLIYGIPGMTHRQWEYTLDEALSQGVQHISAYHLSIEPDTPFGRQGLRPVPEDQSEHQFETLRRKLTDAGFEHYEISNFALPGCRAVHNSAYWSGTPYLGVGPSAHSFDGDRRREWVTADLDEYLAGAGTAQIYDGETLSDLDLRNERIMTGLRTAEGVHESQITNHTSRDNFLREGLLLQNGNNLAIPPEKFLLSDYVTSQFFES